MLIRLDEYIRPTKTLGQTWIGTVVDNDDPKKLRRLKVSIPNFWGSSKNDLPWVSFDNTFILGTEKSFHFVPEIGDKVEVYFPNNDVNFPMYHTVQANEDNKNTYFSNDAEYLNSLGFNLNGWVMRYNKDTENFLIEHPNGCKFEIAQNGDMDILDSSGAEVKLSGGNIDVSDSSGAKVKLSDGKIAIGNGEEVLDILSQTLQALSQSLGNMGAPLSNFSQFITLQTKIDSIKGSL